MTVSRDYQATRSIGIGVWHSLCWNHFSRFPVRTGRFIWSGCWKRNLRRNGCGSGNGHVAVPTRLAAVEFPSLGVCRRVSGTSGLLEPPRCDGLQRYRRSCRRTRI